jgi:hypothetical protein
MPSQTGRTVQVSSDKLINLFCALLSLDLDILNILESDALVIVHFLYLVSYLDEVQMDNLIICLKLNCYW